MMMPIRRSGAILALLVTGCASGRSVVPLSDVTSPPDREVYYVTTTGGEQLDFVTFKSDGATVTGTVREVSSDWSAMVTTNGLNPEASIAT